jgi:hypothetical protein
MTQSLVIVVEKQGFWQEAAALIANPAPPYI